MLIKALCDYYDILAKENKVLPEGYSNVKVNYLICLTPDGKIDDIIDWQKKEETQIGKGKIKEKLVPREIIMPKRTEKSGIEGNIIEHRPNYIFGLNFENGGFTPDDKTNRARKSHEAFVQKNIEFIENLDSPIVNSYRKFIKNWVPEEETENPFLLSLGKNYSNSGFAFCLSGQSNMVLHDDKNIKEKWEEFYKKSKTENKNSKVAQCAINGEVSEIARIHSKIKGVYGGLATGSVLVGFNNPSENSYGNDQSYNSNISENAMEKYTETLNYLLKGKTHKALLDDITVVFWSMSQNEKCDDLMTALFFGESEKISAAQTDEMLKNMMQDAMQGNIVTERIADIENIDTNIDFYMVGLKPNSSRIAIKFIYRKKYADILFNIAKHQIDLQISNELNPVPIWKIKRELISPKSKNDTVDPSLISKVLESIFYGTKYPDFLLANMVRRVKTDSDIKVNAIRAGVIKACINRNLKFLNKKEELKVALDKENNNPAYLCGRLFAVLEKLQQEASNNTLNRTIKDAYFASASSKPAIVFPKILKLAQNHLNKTNRAGYYKGLIEEIIDKLNGEFPETLLLVDQGKFIIGYSQQYQDFFVKKEEKKEFNLQEEK